MVGKHSVGIKFKINISQISFRSLNWPELFKTLKQAMYQTKPVEINLYLQLANQCWWTFLIILTARFYFNKSFLANSLFKLLFRFIFVWPKSRKTVTRFSSFLTVRGLNMPSSSNLKQKKMMPSCPNRTQKNNSH